MARLRGGLTSKLHAVVEERGLLIQFKLTRGHAHDGRSAADMLHTIGPGQMLLADRAYDSNALRRTLAARGAAVNIKPLKHRLTPPPFNAVACRQRNLIERFFSKLKHYRAVADRYEKHAVNYLALVHLAATQIWIRVMSW